MSDVHLAIRMKDASQELDDPTVRAVKAAAEANPGVVHRGDIPKPGGQRLTPALVILAMAGVATLAQFVMDMWERLQGGLVIDVSGEGRPQLYRDPDVPVGYIVILAKDGGVKIESKDAPKSSVQQIIESVVGGVFTSAEQIAQAATQAGAQASTTVRT
jgi:hypothetical protein